MQTRDKGKTRKKERSTRERDLELENLGGVYL